MLVQAPLQRLLSQIEVPGYQVSVAQQVCARCECPSEVVQVVSHSLHYSSGYHFSMNPYVDLLSQNLADSLSSQDPSRSFVQQGAEASQIFL